MRCKPTGLLAIVGQRRQRAAHVAALTSIEIGGVERQRVALRELGVLPFVINRKRTDELVFV